MTVVIAWLSLFHTFFKCLSSVSRDDVRVGRQWSWNKYDWFPLHVLSIWLSFGYGFYEVSRRYVWTWRTTYIEENWTKTAWCTSSSNQWTGMVLSSIHSYFSRQCSNIYVCHYLTEKKMKKKERLNMWY
jgi:hypothetical protein